MVLVILLFKFTFLSKYIHRFYKNKYYNKDNEDRNLLFRRVYEKKEKGKGVSFKYSLQMPCASHFVFGFGRYGALYADPLAVAR